MLKNKKVQPIILFIVTFSLREAIKSGLSQGTFAFDFMSRSMFTVFGIKKIPSFILRTFLTLFFWFIIAISTSFYKLKMIDFSNSAVLFLILVPSIIMVLIDCYATFFKKKI